MYLDLDRIHANMEAVSEQATQYGLSTILNQADCFGFICKMQIYSYSLFVSESLNDLEPNVF